MAGAPAFTEADTHRFTTEARRIIAFARVLEWTVRWTGRNRNVAILTSPGRDKTINIPTTNVNHNRVRSWVKQLLTYSSPISVLNLMEGGFDMVREPDIAQVVAAYGVELSEQIKQWREEDEMRTQTAVAVAMDEAVKERDLKVVEPVEDEPVVEQEAPVEGMLDGRRVVSLRPWLARKGGKDGAGGIVYESPVVMVATFEDGTETYKCRWCEVTSENPRSISAHANRGHSAEEKQIPVAPVELRTDHYEKSDIERPTRRAIAKLSHDIVMALDCIADWQAMDAQQVAEAAARIIVEARPEAHAGEPLTDEQVLRRIEALVDRGRLAEMHREVDVLTESLRVTAEAREAAELKADKLQGNLTALKEMLADA